MTTHPQGLPQMTADSDPVQTPSQAIAYCKSAMGNVPIGSTAYLQLSAHLQGLEHPSHAAEIARLVGENGRLRKYADHLSSCHARDWNYNGPCTCGFSQSLDSAGG